RCDEFRRDGVHNKRPVTASILANSDRRRSHLMRPPTVGSVAGDLVTADAGAVLGPVGDPVGDLLALDGALGARAGRRLLEPLDLAAGLRAGARVGERPAGAVG